MAIEGNVGDISDIKNNKKALFDESGKLVISAAPRDRSTPGGFESETVLRDAYGNIIGGGPITWNNAYSSQKDYERIGDYYFSGNSAAKVVPNSRTDLVNRTLSVAGGTASPASVGVPTVVGGAITGGAIGSLLGLAGGPFGRAFGGVFGTLVGAGQAYNDAAEEAREAWRGQKVTYEVPITFHTDENGKTKATLDYSKMASGGVLSGDIVKEYQDKETTVNLNDKGVLEIGVSPIFANTNLYQTLVKNISQSYAGLSKKDADYEKTIETIKQEIDSWKNRYDWEMRSYAEYKANFDASSDAIVAGYTTELAGYIDPEKMDSYTVNIIDGDGVKEESAKKFFDSVYDMSKDERSKMLENLANIVYGEPEDGETEFSDDQKAIALGEMRALYAVSKNTEGYKDDKYQGMLDADWYVSLISSYRPLGIDISSGIRKISGDKWLNTNQEYLNQSELMQTVGILGGAATTFGISKAFLGSTGKQGILDKILKKIPGVKQLANASLEGTQGGAIAFISQHMGDTAAVTKAAKASFAFNTIKAATFAAAQSGVKTVANDQGFLDTFLPDFATDLALTAIFQYYDVVKYQQAVSDTVTYVYKDTTTGEIKTLKEYSPEITNVDTGTVSRPVAVVAGQVTRAGSRVTLEQDAEGITIFVDDKSVRLKKDGTASSSYSTIYNALRTGVVNTDAPTTADDIASALAKAGVSSADSSIYALPTKDVQSAVAAGKIAKAELTKQGIAINKALFNRNAALDAVNDLAFSKDADRVAWRNANEVFASDVELANNIASDIKNGVYYKPTANSSVKYTLSYGKFREDFGKMKKEDFRYLNAKELIARAQLAQSEKDIDDPRDYLAEAVEKYGKYLGGVSEERAIALDEFQAVRKEYLRDYNISAKKSGYVDAKKLSWAMGSSLQENVGWVPLWRKRETYNGLLNKYYGVGSQRQTIKEWFREGELLDIDDFENPLTVDSRYQSFVAQNMGLAYKTQVAAERLKSAGLLVESDTPSVETKEKRLAAVKNKDELQQKLKDMVAAKRRELRKKVPTPSQYAEKMSTIYEKSGVPDAISDLVEANWGVGEQHDKGLAAAASERIYDGAREALVEAAKYNNIFGRDVDVESFVNTSLMANLKSAIEQKDASMITAVMNASLMAIAPYTSLESVMKTQVDGLANGWYKWAKKNIKAKPVWKDDLAKSIRVSKDELVRLVAEDMNQNTTDGYEMGVSQSAVGMGGRYPITWYREGKPYTRYIKYTNQTEERLAKAVTDLFSDKQLMVQRGIVSRTARALANDFRLLTTGLDPTRATVNVARDTTRGAITPGKDSYASPKSVLRGVVESGGYTNEQKERLNKAIDNAVRKVAGETYNSAYRTERSAQKSLMHDYLDLSGANPVTKFTYDLIHDKRAILEAPGDFFESFTRKRLARSAAANALAKAQREGKDFNKQMEAATVAAQFGGKEYTANFSRKGELIDALSAYVPYLSSAFAGFDGFKRAFIDDPVGVSTNYAMFLLAYMIILADTLGDEQSRKNYYRLSDYDRGNSIVLSLDNNSLLTIPLDQETASFLFPYRRVLETLNGVDPVSFYEFVWGSLTEPIPFDLSGFSEDGVFNLKRGIERLASQLAPTAATGAYEALTGTNLYYGSTNEITDEYLESYGIYSPEAGDYTTKSKNSALLREIANKTGIPQWQLQVLLNNFGGNVGQYILNTIDKLSGATEAAQGGKDVLDAVFKSFVGTDSDNASNQFYSGIKELQQEKQKLLQQLADINEDEKTATGDELYKLQTQFKKAKDDFGTKVADFVSQYLNAYEITGGLSRSQAMQIYYLFRLDDDKTIYEYGSVGESYANQANQQMKNEATRLAAPVLDKYYDQVKHNIYQAADGTWKVYSPYGEQATLNTIYGEGVRHEVGLRNLIEGKNNSLKNAYNAAYSARREAYEAKDYDAADKIGAEFDMMVVERIAPYIERYGAEVVIGNSDVLEYLEDWFFVPSNYIRTKNNKYVSLAHNASTQRAFVRPYIKELFGLPTTYSSYSELKNLNLPVGSFDLGGQ